MPSGLPQGDVVWNHLFSPVHDHLKHTVFKDALDSKCEYDTGLLWTIPFLNVLEDTFMAHESGDWMHEQQSALRVADSLLGGVSFL